MSEEEFEDLTVGMIICELCGRRFTPKGFYDHLSQHSREELETLKKLAETTINMTSEQYAEFLLELECEAYRRAKESMET